MSDTQTPDLPLNTIACIPKGGKVLLQAKVFKDQQVLIFKCLSLSKRLS